MKVHMTLTFSVEEVYIYKYKDENKYGIRQVVNDRRNL